MPTEDIINLINDLVASEEEKAELIAGVNRHQEKEVFAKITELLGQQVKAIEEKYSPQIKELEELYADEQKELNAAEREFNQKLDEIEQESEKLYSETLTSINQIDGNAAK